MWISGWNNPETIQGHSGYKLYYGPTNVICSNNIIKHSGYSGIIAKWKVQNILISENIIDYCYLNVLDASVDSVDGGCGIKVTGYGGSNLNDQGETITLTVISENISIINNKISNVKRCGVYLDRVNNFKIHNNSFLNVGTDEKLDGTTITTDDKDYNILIYINNHASCNGDGSIYDNNYNDIRNDKNTINYINYKYSIIKAPYLFILRNYFQYYNNKGAYIEASTNIINEDNDFSFNTANVFSLTNDLNTISLIYNKLEALNITILPKLINCASNVTKILSNGEQTVASLGIIRKTADHIYDYAIYVPYLGLTYLGRISSGNLANKFKVTGSALT